MKASINLAKISIVVGIMQLATEIVFWLIMQTNNAWDKMWKSTSIAQIKSEIFNNDSMLFAVTMMMIVTIIILTIFMTYLAIRQIIAGAKEKFWLGIVSGSFFLFFSPVALITSALTIFLKPSWGHWHGNWTFSKLWQFKKLKNKKVADEIVAVEESAEAEIEENIEIQENVGIEINIEVYFQPFINLGLRDDLPQITEYEYLTTYSTIEGIKGKLEDEINSVIILVDSYLPTEQPISSIENEKTEDENNDVVEEIPNEEGEQIIHEDETISEETIEPTTKDVNDELGLPSTLVEIEEIEEDFEEEKGIEMDADENDEEYDVVEMEIEEELTDKDSSFVESSFEIKDEEVAQVDDSITSNETGYDEAAILAKHENEIMSEDEVLEEKPIETEEEFEELTERDQTSEPIYESTITNETSYDEAAILAQHENEIMNEDNSTGETVEESEPVQEATINNETSYDEAAILAKYENEIMSEDEAQVEVSNVVVEETETQDETESSSTTEIALISTPIEVESDSVSEGQEVAITNETSYDEAAILAQHENEIMNEDDSTGETVEESEPVQEATINNETSYDEAAILAKYENEIMSEDEVQVEVSNVVAEETETQDETKSSSTTEIALISTPIEVESDSASEGQEVAIANETSYDEAAILAKHENSIMNEDNSTGETVEESEPAQEETINNETSYDEAAILAQHENEIMSEDEAQVEVSNVVVEETETQGETESSSTTEIALISTPIEIESDSASEGQEVAIANETSYDEAAILAKHENSIMNEDDSTGETVEESEPAQEATINNETSYDEAAILAQHENEIMSEDEAQVEVSNVVVEETETQDETKSSSTTEIALISTPIEVESDSVSEGQEVAITNETSYDEAAILAEHENSIMNEDDSTGETVEESEPVQEATINNETSYDEAAILAKYENEIMIDDGIVVDNQESKNNIVSQVNESNIYKMEQVSEFQFNAASEQTEQDNSTSMESYVGSNASTLNSDERVVISNINVQKTNFEEQYISNKQINESNYNSPNDNQYIYNNEPIKQDVVYVQQVQQQSETNELQNEKIIREIYENEAKIAEQLKAQMQQVQQQSAMSELQNEKIIKDIYENEAKMSEQLKVQMQQVQQLTQEVSRILTKLETEPKTVYVTKEPENNINRSNAQVENINYAPNKEYSFNSSEKQMYQSNNMYANDINYTSTQQLRYPEYNRTNSETVTIKRGSILDRIKNANIKPEHQKDMSEHAIKIEEKLKSPSTENEVANRIREQMKKNRKY